MNLLDPGPQLPAVTLDELSEGEIIGGLTDERLRLVLLLRHGCGGVKRHTHQEIAELLEVSRERARQLERIALVNLRAHREREQGLRDD